jgi:hypothetical protein
MSKGPNPYDGLKDFTEYELNARKGIHESFAIGEWKRCLDNCDGDGFEAARVFKREQPALFKLLEESGKSFEDLCELGGLMSGSHELNGPGEWH